MPVYVLMAVFDSIPEGTLYKLQRKQEETTRSLEKIEKGKSRRLECGPCSRTNQACCFATVLTRLVCYTLRLRLIEFGDKPEVLRHLAKRAMDAANMSGGGEGN